MNLDIKKLQRAIVDGIEDVKGHNIVVFNTEHLSPLFERVIIASGTSNRQTKALAQGVRDAVKGRGMQVLRTEGEDNGEWIIVDCGAAVVHLMQPSIRDYYHLEEIWGDKPVKMKLDTTPVRLVKASEPEPVVRKMAAKSTAKKVAAKKAPARTPVKATAGASAKRAPAKKAAAKRPAGRSTGVTRTVGVKSAAAKSPARAPAAKAVAAKKVAAKKPAAKKAPARKTSGRA